MPIELSKKKSKSSKKSEPQKYPTYVGDLPVKIIQDIIDNLAVNDDWEEVAGKTGVSARAIASLKSKRHNRAEMANIVFEQWLCRIPKPVDLANLLLSVNRIHDTKKLKPFISPDDWKTVEKKINRITSVGTKAPSNPAFMQQDRLTSVEESSVLLPVQSQPPSQSSSTITGPDATHSVVPPRPVSNPPRAVASSLSELKPEIKMKVPTSARPTPPVSYFRPPQSDIDLYQDTQRSLAKYTPMFPSQDHQFETISERHQHIYSFGSRWLAKDLVHKSGTVNGYKNFCREVAALLRFRHPNIIPLSGYIVSDNCYYLIYPYMSNSSLEEHLVYHKFFEDADNRLMVMIHVAEALSFLHDGSFIHGDLSMSNILLDKNMHPYLTDFELSIDLRDVSDDNDPDIREGTVPYFPPDEFSRPSRAVDIYAFGVLLALVFNRREWKGWCERGVELVSSLFRAVRPAPNLERAHEKLYRLCLQCIHDEEIDMEIVLEQLNDANTSSENEYGVEFHENPFPKGPIFVSELTIGEDSDTESDD